MGQSLGHRQASCAAVRWWTDKLRSTNEGYTLWLTSPNDHIQEFKWVLWPKHLKSVQLKKKGKKVEYENRILVVFRSLFYGPLFWI